MSRPWQTLDRLSTPDGELELRRRGDPVSQGDAGHCNFLILLDGRIVMTSAETRSEMALGALAGEFASREHGPVLIGGLGMGLTLRAALDVVAPSTRVIVAELNPAIEAWCRGPLAPLSGRALEDPRVRVEISDVALCIAKAAEDPSKKLAAILLDLYQGPPSRLPADDPLFGRDALRTTRQSLQQGGLLAVWSETRSPAFARELARQAFSVEVRRPARGRGHVLYVARAASVRSGA